MDKPLARNKTGRVARLLNRLPPAPASTLAACACALLAQTVVAATHFTDSEASIANAISAAVPGDTIVVKDGVYTFPVRINGRDGTAASPITFKAQTVGGVTFTGPQLSDRTKLRVERDHWVIDGFRFTDVTADGTQSSDRVTVVRVREASDNVLRNLSISDSGLTSSNPDSNAANNSMYLDITDRSARNVVERSEFLNNNDAIVVRVAGGSTDLFSTDNVFRYNYWSGNAGYETLQLSWGSSAGAAFRTVVEHNLWEDNASSSELISSKSSENVFRHNTFEHNNDQLVLRGGNDGVVDSNYFIDGRGVRAYGADHTITNNYFEGSYGTESGNLRGGILLGAGDHDDAPYAAVRNSEVSNNSIINTGAYSLLYGYFYNATWNGDLIDIPPYDNEFSDNLIVNSRGKAIDRQNNAPDASNTWSGNYTWSTGSGSPGHAPDGVTTGADPQLERDSLGNLVATAAPDAGARMRYRRLTADDVGPGSTFVAGLAGDYDQDGQVSQSDWLRWQSLYRSQELAADGNFDGEINAADYTVWRDAQQAAAASVPEASAVALAASVLTGHVAAVYRARR
ncbi:chondroitinase-B domain-containing protein [Botrimarina sp.]|uniref:chondroitinase-B domain-containing protein n=1 Tax=Botrimarina sp. TaxID=2795802 RepID=UPI0032F087CD